MSLTQLITYNSGISFVYDSTLVDFSSGQAKLKSKAPATATFNAQYNIDTNGDYGGGSLTGTASGAVIAASGGEFSQGALNCNGGTVKYVYYTATGNADSAQVGAISMWIKPNYSGVPAGVRQFFSISKDHSTLPNLIESYHNSGDGHVWFRCFDSAGSSIFSADLGVWTPVSGTQYYFEWNYDITLGASRLFIGVASGNATQLGATQSATGTRSSANIGFFNLGTDRTLVVATDMQFSDVTVYNTVQHTAVFAVPSVSNQKYSTANPSIVVSSGVLADGFDGLTDVESVAGSDLIQGVISVDGQDKYWDGAAWSNSSGYSQSNIVTTLNANHAALSLIGNTLKLKLYLHSSRGNTTPSLTSAALLYNFFATKGTPSTCVVYAWAKDFLNADDQNAQLIIENPSPFFNGNFLVKPGKQSFQFNSLNQPGYLEEEMIVSAIAGKSYTFSLQYTDALSGTVKTVTIGQAQVPNSATAALSSFLVPA